MLNVTAIALSILTACAGAGRPDSGAGMTGVDVSVSVADTSRLPTDQVVSFEVRRQPEGGGDIVEMGAVPLDGTAQFAVEPGDWRISASFSWDDPSKADTETQDTGGYLDTECSGSVSVQVVVGAVTAAAIAADCADEHLD